MLYLIYKLKEVSKILNTEISKLTGINVNTIAKIKRGENSTWYNYYKYNQAIGNNIEDKASVIYHILSDVTHEQYLDIVYWADLDFTTVQYACDTHFRNTRRDTIEKLWEVVNESL